MKQSRCTLVFLRLYWTKISTRSLVTRVLEEYRPEAASLARDVFDALYSAVDHLVDDGKSLPLVKFQTAYQCPRW